ncbi:MAG: HD-GYP domain-containing protein [Wenzhouxiangella sp.]
MTQAKDQSTANEFWRTEMVVHPLDLEIGHFVIRLDRPWLDTPFELQGVEIDSPKAKQWFVDHCQWVVVDYQRSSNQSRPEQSERLASAMLASRQADPDHPINALQEVRLDEESVGMALKGYSLLDDQARRLLRSAQDNESFDSTAAKAVVDELASALNRNLAALVWLTRIKDIDDYQGQHAVNCAILAMGLAHALEWAPAQVEISGMAGLLHDIGNLKVDQDILKKPARLTAEEFAEIKSHTIKGRDLLMAESRLPAEVATAALEHHERMDGRGYPGGQRGEAIHPLARLISIVDVYDAVTSHRPYRRARSHHDALSILWRGRGQKFDRLMVETFIRFMGWVSPGTLVRLSDGQLAVVEQTNAKKGFYPIVRILRRQGNTFQAGPRLNLARLHEGGDNSTLKVVEVLPDGAAGLSVKSLLVAAAEPGSDA